MRHIPAERPDCAGQERTLSVGKSAQFTRIEALGEGCTLAFYTSDPLLPADAQVDTPLRAVVTAGSGGGGFRVELDVENGTMITVPAGSISVAVFYDLDADGPAPVTPDINVGLVVYEVPRPGSARPIRTVRAPSVPNMGTASIPIPRFAASVTILVDSPAAYGLNLLANFQRSLSARARGTVFVQGPTPLRIPGGSRSIGIDNRTGAPVIPTLVFELAL